MTPADPKFLNECRSSVCSTVFLTQNINNYISAYHLNAEAMTNSLLAGMNTKIAHRNGDFRTNQWMADTISKGITARYSWGTSEGTNDAIASSAERNASSSSGGGGPSSSSGGGSSTSVTRSRERGSHEDVREEIDYQVQPELFTRLRSGSPRHNYEVEAIIFKSGETFQSTGRPFTGVIFDQRS